jgi:hypothetical protein
MTAAMALILLLSKADLGKLPPGWEVAQTGAGKGSVWKVVEDATTPSKSGFALAQTAVGPNDLFNLCVATKSQFGNNIALSVALKPVQGELDQGGGVVWLYQDANNYYITRYNPLESNFRIYKVVSGKRTQLATLEKIPGEPKAWHTIRVTHVGKEITCILDAKHRLNVTDETFQKPGQVGLWTKADAQTRFDRFTVDTIKK